MLTAEDLQALRAMMKEEVAASENRMMTFMEKGISASENRMMTYIESNVEKKIAQIADGHKMLAEKMDRMEQKLDALSAKVDGLQGEVVAQEFVLTRLNKAQ